MTTADSWESCPHCEHFIDWHIGQPSGQPWTGPQTLPLSQVVVNDPGYREEIGHVALKWAFDKGDEVDTAIVCEALDRLAEPRGGMNQPTERDDK